MYTTQLSSTLIVFDAFSHHNHDFILKLPYIIFLMNIIYIVKCNYIFIYVTFSSSVYYRLQTSGRRKIVWFVKTGSEKDTYKVGRNDIVLFEIFISILGAKLVNYKCFSFLKIKENISPPIQGLEKLFFFNQNPVKSLCQSASETTFSMSSLSENLLQQEGGW